MSRLSNLWDNIQSGLFPWLEAEIGALNDKLREFVLACELAQLDKFMAPFRGSRNGRTKLPRIDFAKAFLAKPHLNITETKALRERLLVDAQLRRICGWNCAKAIPSEATFCRAFAEFARAGLGDLIHKAMATAYGQEKLVGHLSRDATAIPVRERPPGKPACKPTPKPERKRGRPRKDELREPAPPRRLVLQPGRTLEANLADLPRDCDLGRKRNSQGHEECWRGYKLHADVADGGVPISAVVTSASVHDSQVAVPLAQMSARRVRSCYDLMDSAYNAEEILDFSRSLGHVPIADARRREPKPKTPIKLVGLETCEAIRFRERSASERFNSDLKDNRGVRHIRVRGHAKVSLHLMFAVVAITAVQMLRLIPKPG